MSQLGSKNESFFQCSYIIIRVFFFFSCNNKYGTPGKYKAVLQGIFLFPVTFSETVWPLVYK